MEILRSHMLSQSALLCWTRVRKEWGIMSLVLARRERKGGRIEKTGKNCTWCEDF